MVIVLEKVAPNGERLVSTGNELRGVEWKSTCENCEWRGNTLAEPDWISLAKPEQDRRKYLEIDRYPKRCTSCDTISRRYSRMTESLNKIIDVKRDLIRNRAQLYSRPKMITIGNSESLSLEEYKKRFTKWRKKSPWLLGGYYVFEQGSENGMWHSHGVYLAPWINSEKLEDWSNSSKEFGLGSMHYQEAKINKDFKDKHLSNYIAKYLCKDGNRRQSFGALRLIEKETTERSNGTLWKRWIQPDRSKYQSQIKQWIATEGKQWR